MAARKAFPLNTHIANKLDLRTVDQGYIIPQLELSKITTQSSQQPLNQLSLQPPAELKPNPARIKLYVQGQSTPTPSGASSRDSRKPGCDVDHQTLSPPPHSSPQLPLFEILQNSINSSTTIDSADACSPHQELAVRGPELFEVETAVSAS